MIPTHSRIVDQGDQQALSPRRSIVLHAADVLLPVSLGLWALGISRTNGSVLGAYGLLPDLPLTAYLGVALLVISAAIELTRDRPPSRWRMSAHAVGLVTMLYATAPLVYPEGRYSWLYKTIGVVQYINQHGQLNYQIDIYQNWPGFFALAAWFGKVSGIASPLSYAKWAQLVFELAALPILYVAYEAVSLSPRQRWLALLLYPAANWIGQDYYSPQGLGTLLSLGVIAVALRWLYRGNHAQFLDARLLRRRGKKSLPAESASAISQQEVWDAYQAVKAGQSTPGVDGVTIDAFERNLQENLTGLWRLMSSGDYMPAPLQMVKIPARFDITTLAIPTLSDAIAQTVVARRLQTRLTELTSQRQNAMSESRVHDASQSSIWSLNLDFDIVAHDFPRSLILRAVEATSQNDWEVLYVRRWLRAPVQGPEGPTSNRQRNRGSQVGSTISATLDDVFLHYTFDIWLSRDFPDVRFERDGYRVVVNCISERRAHVVWVAIAQRMEELEVRPPLLRIRKTRAEERMGPSFESLMPGSRQGEQGNRRSQASQESINRHASDKSLTRHASTVAYVSTIALIYFVLTFTHELSPYIVAIQIATLAVVRLLRPRLVIIVLAAIAIGYLLPRLSYVNNHYGLLGSVGSFFRNVRPPHSATSIPIPKSENILYDCSNALSGIMWVMALVGAWMRRKSRHTVLTLLLLAFSPILVLALQAYGNEGVLRVYLFSLPWSAALAASAVAPSYGIGKVRRRRQGVTREGHQRFRLQGASIRVAGVLGIAVALFFPAFFGSDGSDVMPQQEVATITAFMNSAPPGPILEANDNDPLSDTARYNLFPLQIIFGSDSAWGNRPVTSSIAEGLAQYTVAYTHGRSPAYVIVTPSMIAANEAVPATVPRSFSTLLSSLAHSRWWKLLVNDDGTIIYEISPGTHVPLPTGAEPVPIFGLP